MKRVAVAAVALVISALVLVYAWQRVSTVTAWQYLSLLPSGLEGSCDGNFPGWMLEAQDYGGDGCAYELPWYMAPPAADWTVYCTMWCDRTWPPEDE